MKNITNAHKYGLDRRESETALEAFLNSKNEAKVFAINGDWGVGKTHLVKSFLSKIKRDYHYGSAFGITTIDELKMQLWSNFISSESTNATKSKRNPRNLFKSIKDHSQNIANIIEAIPNMGEYGTGFTPAIITLTSNLVINNALKEKLICIDDIERRSKNLPLNELLGFIENLTEEKNCKVILIYNESKIDSESINTLKEYREKVIDYEIKFAPSSAENFRIGFGENYPDESIIFDYFNKEYIQANNIRVFKKLKWNLEKLRPSIDGFSFRVRHRIINEIIFVSLSKFDDSFPVDLSKLVALGSFQEDLSNKKEDERDLYFLALDLGFTDSAISNEIIRLVETSYCDYKKFCEEVGKLNGKENELEIKEKLSEAYEPYSESFGGENDIFNNLMNFLNQHWKFLGFRELQQLEAISEAINLDLKPYKAKWCKYQIDSSENLEKLYDLQAIFQGNPNFGTNDLISELKKKIFTFEEEMSIDAILMKILETRSWSKKDADYLNGRTLEQYKQWLLEKHPEKYRMIKKGLEMEEEFSQILRGAIIALAQGNKLNTLRAEKLYRINLE